MYTICSGRTSLMYNCPYPSVYNHAEVCNMLQVASFASATVGVASLASHRTGMATQCQLSIIEVIKLSG